MSGEAREASVDSPEDERELADCARRGDRSAFARIVEQNAAAVYRVVAGHLGAGEAEDATQEVFLLVLQGLGRFRGESRLATWIYRIATNVALKRRGRRRRRPASEPLESELIVPDEHSPGAVAAAREEQQALRAALGQLPPEQRAVVVLRGIEGLSFDEVARVLGIPLPTAQSRMARAKERLRALLGRLGEGE